MANWYGKARTNYFKVLDPEKFREEMAGYEVTVIESWAPHGDVPHIHEDDPPYVGLIAATEDGDWPSSILQEGVDENGDPWEDYVDIDFPEIVRPHLAEDQVALFFTVGNEKARYLTGHAVAVINTEDRDFLTINLDEIYDRVHKEWGIKTSRAEY